MLHRKLLEVLARLAPEEHKSLRLFLQSPYFNQGGNSTQLTALYDYISVRDSDENHPELIKELVHERFFPNRPFREKEKSPLDSLASDLFRLVRQFVTQKDFEQEQNAAIELLPLMRFYRKNSMEERFWQTVETVRKIQNNNPTRGAQYFLDQFRIEEEISNFQGVFNTYEDDANLNTVNLLLDKFFIILKLEYACAIEHRHKSSQINSVGSPILMKAVLDLIEQESYSDSPLVQMYDIVLHLIHNPLDENLLKKFEILLEKHKQSIPFDKYRDLQAYYRAFWGRHYMHMGNEFYRLKLFEVMDKHLQAGYFYIDQKLTPMALRVLTNSGLKLTKFDWVKKVLDDHPPERICGTKYPVEAHSLNVAEYHFHKKEYVEAEAKLTYRAFENPNFSISADVLLIKIYCDTHSELLDSRMKALEQKVRRTRISAETKAGYYNFLKKLDKVIKYGWQKNSPRRAKLVEDVRTTPSVFAREWLLEKLEAGAG